MSIDLEWSQLSPLSNRLVEIINRQLQSAQRPSFIGPITVESFEFGSVAPDVELVDVRDVYKDFLEDEDGDKSDRGGSGDGSTEEGSFSFSDEVDDLEEEEEEDEDGGDDYSDEHLDQDNRRMPRDPQELRRMTDRLAASQSGRSISSRSRPSVDPSAFRRPIGTSEKRTKHKTNDRMEGTRHQPKKETVGKEKEKLNEFEWVSRRGVGRGLAEEGPGYHLFPPHVRYGGGHATSLSGAPNPFDYTRSLSGSIPTTSRDASHESGSSKKADPYESFTPPIITNSTVFENRNKGVGLPPISSGESSGTHSGGPQSPVNADLNLNANTTAPPSSLPHTANDLQVHLRVIFHSDMRISLTTSLILNYPSPLFMALPIRLSIVGFEFNGEVVVAYQGSRKRVHVTILDDEDPYRPATASATASGSTSDLAGKEGSGDGATAGIPSLASLTLNEQTNRGENSGLGQLGARMGSGSGNRYYDRNQERQSVGLRLLPHIFIESEIGQTDKQVLRNVSRVERFIQDTVRTTLEDELVFPNFHTIVYADES